MQIDFVVLLSSKAVSDGYIRKHLFIIHSSVTILFFVFVSLGVEKYLRLLSPTWF